MNRYIINWKSWMISGSSKINPDAELDAEGKKIRVKLNSVRCEGYTPVRAVSRVQALKDWKLAFPNDAVVKIT